MKRLALIPFLLAVFPCIASADDDPQEIARATEFLREVHRVYAELPAMTDVMTTNFSMDGRDDANSTIRVKLSKNEADERTPYSCRVSPSPGRQGH